MRRIASAAFAVVLGLACACNLLSGASDLDPSLADLPCEGCDGGGTKDGGGTHLGDGALVSDVQKDGDDLTPGGFIDATWGSNGITRSTLLSQAFGVAVASDGRVYVVGPSGSHLAVVRFGVDGKVDTTFGTGGRLSIPMGVASGGSLPNVYVPYARAGIAIDSADRVVVAGTSQESFSDPNPDGGAPIARYERYLYAARIAGNALDPTFAQGGRYRPSPAVDGEGARAVAIAPGDGVVLVGSGPTGSFTVWRLTASGNPDPAFGQAGRAVIAVPSGNAAVSAAVNGTSAVAAGGSNGDFAVGQVNAAGVPAPGFGSDAGIAIAKPGPGDDMAWGVAALPDGRIVVGGSKSQSSVRSPIFAVARLMPDGALDPSFAGTGIAAFDFDNGGTWKEVEEDLRGLVVDSRGRVVVAGGVLEKPQMGPPLYRAVLARVKEDGTLDPLFGAGGRVTFTDVPQNRLRATALARAANGSLLVAGNVDGSSELFVARIIP